MPTGTDKREIYNLCSSEPLRITPLSGGCVSEVFRVELADGEQLVAKHTSKAAVEAGMLRYLQQYATNMPVPNVYACKNDWLLLEYLAHDSSARLSEHGVADFIARLQALHAVQEQRFGFPQDTVLGMHTQPNAWRWNWPLFYAEQRLLPFGRLARDRGLLSRQTLGRLERLCLHVHERLDSPPHSSLLHGDLWRGNMLVRQGRLVGVIDPAIYYGHVEVEIAYMIWIGAMNHSMLRIYAQQRPLAKNFYPERYKIYTLYPLLAHVLIMGPSYIPEFVQTLHELV